MITEPVNVAALIAEVEQALANITPGPWEVCRHLHIDDEPWFSVNQVADAEGMKEWIAEIKYLTTAPERQHANVDLIAAAPSLLSACLAALRAQQETLDKLYRDIGTVRQVAERRSDRDADYKAMLIRLNQWEQLAAPPAVSADEEQQTCCHCGAPNEGYAVSGAYVCAKCLADLEEAPAAGSADEEQR
jgi:hypothetical protein